MDAPVELSKILPASDVDSSTAVTPVQRPMRLRGVARGTIRAYRPGPAGDEVLLVSPSAASADSALRPEDWVPEADAVGAGLGPDIEVFVAQVYRRHFRAREVGPAGPPVPKRGSFGW